MIPLKSMTGFRIGLASPQQIRSWSHGEVTKPETLNFRTLKPEKDGLFCEKIFGPSKSWTCACGKYKKVRFKGLVCERCGVLVTHNRVRRERMGHIELAAPVGHPWYVKGTPSYMALLLDISPRHLKAILSYACYAVIDIDERARREAISLFDQQISMLEQTLVTIPHEQVQQAKEMLGHVRKQREVLLALSPMALLGVERYRDLRQEYGHMFRAGSGAETLREILAGLDLDSLTLELRQQLADAQGAARKKIVRRLRIVEAFRSSHATPEWMILSALPILPPDLRPILHLEGTRLASADANALYVSVINRNNRLKKLMSMNAPEIILNNERRKLQDACDALFDNARQARPLLGPTGLPLKSLSDLLRGKEGRFRHNLLGKRVDYSGRSVIVVGPDLKLYQCGLPKKIALELFKPFIIAKLLEYGYAAELRSAKRYVEHRRPAVWDILEEVMRGRLVLLNRAPSLHRMSIQAFEPLLIEGDAIQLPALVTSAFNADFDGDQMAVHLPLSHKAQQEARNLLWTPHNLLHPATGEPAVSLSQDMVLGCYYLTQERPTKRQRRLTFADQEEALLAYYNGVLGLQVPIWIRLPDAAVYEAAPPEVPVVRQANELVQTTVGRVLFNAVLPQGLRYRNYAQKKQTLKQLIAECYQSQGVQATVKLADDMKQLGFAYASKSGISFAMSDVHVPDGKPAVLADADAKLLELDTQLAAGFITEEEHYEQAVALWNRATDDVTSLVQQELDPYGSVATISNSGATKAGFQQIRQLCGMRGLMASPSGKIIAIPVRGNFLMGLSVVEYFISCHGARKGFMDRSLNTAQSGYLFIRLINAAQSVIVSEHDCGTRDFLWVKEEDSRAMGLPSSRSRLIGRVLARPIVGSDMLVEGRILDEASVDLLLRAGIREVPVRSVLGCQTPRGVCQTCYGYDLSSSSLVQLGVAAGIIAAQSIGEPSTQLTMRTFHTGGVAGVSDITQGLPRVAELFEAQVPKNPALLSDIEGEVVLEKSENKYILSVLAQPMSVEYRLPQAAHVVVKEGKTVRRGQVIATLDAANPPVAISAPLSGQMRLDAQGQWCIFAQEQEKRTYSVPLGRKLAVKQGQHVGIGSPLTTGPLDPLQVLGTLGREAVQAYLLNEVRAVYRATGVYIHDKHFEVIVREMLRHVLIEESGDTSFFPLELVDRFEYAALNASILAQGGEPAKARTVLLGLTKTALASSSWLAAASFQETTRVLAEAALLGKTDFLLSMKENVMLGRLIPAGTGFNQRRK